MVFFFKQLQLRNDIEIHAKYFPTKLDGTLIAQTRSSGSRWTQWYEIVWSYQRRSD